MNGKMTRIRSLSAVAGVSLLALGTVVSPQAMAQSETQAQPSAGLAQLAELPSIADLADRLLPAVVEITIETKSVSAARSFPTRPTTMTIRRSRISSTSSSSASRARTRSPAR